MLARISKKLLESAEALSSPIGKRKSMTSVLVISFSADIHLHSVLWAGKILGARIEGICSDFFPINHRMSIRIPDEKSKQLAQWTGTKKSRLSWTDFDTVWNRRAPLFRFPAELYVGDQEFAEMECQSGFGGNIELRSSKQFYVNDPAEAMRARNKIRQLEMARQVGLKIPDTLITNSAEELSDFFDAHQGNIIYKRFTNKHSWFSPSKGLQWDRRTVPIKKEQLQESDSLACTPGIFQPNIDKKHEIRAVITGHSIMSFNIYSQEHPNARQDWRVAQDELRIERVDLSAHLKSKCLKLMNNLGLVFGVLDLIVTTDNEVVFLEVNEQGQFLGYENDELPFLQMITEFLLSGDPCFRFGAASSPLSYKKFEQSAEYKLFCSALAKYKSTGTMTSRIME